MRQQWGQLGTPSTHSLLFKGEAEICLARASGAVSCPWHPYLSHASLSKALRPVVSVTQGGAWRSAENPYSLLQHSACRTSTCSQPCQPRRRRLSVLCTRVSPLCLDPAMSAQDSLYTAT